MIAVKAVYMALAMSMAIGALGLELDVARDPSSAAASAAAAGLWRQHYDAARQFKADFKQNPRATANKCRPGSNAMCAAAAGSSQAAVLIATSPDFGRPRSTSGRMAVW
ncbi:hypothetical protein OEZ85_009973 [Tetradesmus obliquus]|uniref:Uncharacterized protein n=1 Tax=Tetradesmus obliquus TaxID=3088 RepID=A0ABY8UAN9_TETOB|nr:hypothetical protein OEZ85_009973 [Tetradesmus obliquus]